MAAAFRVARLGRAKKAREPCARLTRLRFCEEVKGVSGYCQGPYTTDFCTWSSSMELWTAQLPDPISCHGRQGHFSQSAYKCKWLGMSGN